MNAVKILIIGAGSRGSGYAMYAAEHPEKAQVVGVAEPREFYRQRLVDLFNIPPQNVALDWREFAGRPKFADAVLVATQDAMHKEPALAFMQVGYDILLEKPLAPDAADCRSIVDAALASGVIFAVCHVMRYTTYTQKVKEVVDAGHIGEIVSIQHLEPVGYYHQAHSYVRGNWRNTALSSPMLLAKSCHDLDWLRYILGQKCTQVSSFGSLQHFRKQSKPEQAGDAVRCLDCAYELQCPYSAKRLYATVSAKFLEVVTPDQTKEGILKALQEGPYGRCVYECDNDVVDHQVVNLLYEKGATASFTMTAFTEMAQRRTTIFGTRGELRGDGTKIEVFDFLSNSLQPVEFSLPARGVLSGHGGGDRHLMERFIAAVGQQDQSLLLSGALESLETHLTVFAAEQARLENRVVRID